MARLMVVSIQNRGDAVLIVARHANVDHIGYVTRTVLSGLVPNHPSMCNCVSFVELNLPKIEQILLRITTQHESSAGQMLCVELTAADLAEATDWNLVL